MKTRLQPHPDTALESPDNIIQFLQIPWKDDFISIEYQWIGDTSSSAPCVVFLHEGLGSVSMWRDFPQRFCREHGFRGLVFSRYGYGRSTPRPPRRDLQPAYLHEQAYEALPALLTALHVERPWLFGHSDGGSIALLYAARFPAEVSGIIVMAPHIFVEDITIDGIRKAREAFLNTDLPARLARHHTDAESVFWGWNNAWLNPAFRAWNIEDELCRIACPALAIQGEGDEYGTLEQIYGIARKAPDARALAVAGCGHSPHRDQPEIVGKAAAEFIRASMAAA
jgi:pimeloyl-ACP methyl ester carboxylesterase